MNDLVWIFVSALLINNFVLSYFLGLCPFLGVSSRLETAFRLGLANIFVMLITAFCAWFLNTYILIHAPYLQADQLHRGDRQHGAVHRDGDQKAQPRPVQGPGYLSAPDHHQLRHPGPGHLRHQPGYGLLEGMIFALGAGAGFTLALVLMAGLREEVEMATRCPP